MSPYISDSGAPGREYSKIRDDPAARVAYHFTHKFPHDLSFFHDLEGYKVFGDPHDFLVKAKVGVRDHFLPNFFAEAKVEFQWDSTPANGKKREDVLYILGLGWTF